ncbi:hypothetical protein B566_EDAN002521 [Ephemera danica]|nr:hypothetical protein B566_EDAN002521 [Ephemera danica]
MENTVLKEPASEENPVPLAKKQPMAEKERLALCEKLDRELETYISGLERKSYTEGWPEDKWQEEMEKHPFFMTKPLEEAGPLPPLLEGIQQLKYDPEENTTEELANNYKEDGNFNFKYGKYRLAILSYTEGLRAKSINSTINSELHNNRAAAHFFLKNYRSSLMDCEAALKLQPNYLKAIRKAAKCCQLMGRPDDCIKWCDQGLEETSWKAGDELDLASLEPCFPAAAHCPVCIGPDQRMTWPVLFLYPHYGVTDLVQKFHEDSTFEAHLNELFPEDSRAEWDSEGVFSSVSALNIYFESEDKTELVEVKKSSTLGHVLRDSRYCVYNGTPSFLVVVDGSAAEKRIKHSLS